MRTRGRLLVASPLLRDPNFIRTVIYCCAHNEDGALGVVLNRPHPVAVGEVIERFAGIVSEPESLFGGGPVDLESAIALGWLTGEDPEDGRFSTVEDPIVMLDLNREPDELAEPLSAARIFVGYAGWGAGQLDEELAEQAWVVVDALPTDIFSRTPERLWGEVLRRQGGGVAMLSTYTDVPTVN